MLTLYNTRTKKVEEFKALDTPRVTMYCCGPTVYDYAHIGNFRTYTVSDFLVRTLKYLSFDTTYVMNITDVGHIVSDADQGEDKLEKGAKREGKTAWEIASFYTQRFIEDSKKLNLLEPDVRPKATDHIAEQIRMVQTLLEKGFAYQLPDGIYFDTAKFPTYGALTGQNLDELKEGARVEANPDKHNPTDFTLWKFSPHDQKRQMEWDSPWGKGFPGWHIECSAMSKKYLGIQFDIHTGGVDLIPVHHTNEIAQSECSSGKSPVVSYWVHIQFLMVDGEKMAKSKGNFYKIADIEKKGFDPLALRYFYMTSHYRTFSNFTWEGLEAANTSLLELKKQVIKLKNQNERTTLSDEKVKKIDAFRNSFIDAVSDDLNMPKALAVVWETIKSNIPSPDKYDLLISFDDVLGLNLSAPGIHTEKQVIPNEITELMKKRDELRAQKKFTEADVIRKQIETEGYILEDSSAGAVAKKN
jgi:cysteinyl-tRNA synthetase